MKCTNLGLKPFARHKWVIQSFGSWSTLNTGFYLGYSRGIWAGSLLWSHEKNASQFWWDFKNMHWAWVNIPITYYLNHSLTGLRPFWLDQTTILLGSWKLLTATMSCTNLSWPVLPYTYYDPGTCNYFPHCQLQYDFEWYIYIYRLCHIAVDLLCIGTCFA